jgi:hypothetical protein
VGGVIEFSLDSETDIDLAVTVSYYECQFVCCCQNYVFVLLLGLSRTKVIAVMLSIAFTVVLKQERDDTVPFCSLAQSIHG